MRQKEPETKAEKVLWEQLKTHPGEFKPQKRVAGYTPDFYSHKLKLAIEVDGSIHRFKQTDDKVKDIHLRSFGIRVLRFRNKDIFQDCGHCVRQINAKIHVVNKDKGRLKTPKWKLKD